MNFSNVVEVDFNLTYVEDGSDFVMGNLVLVTNAPMTNAVCTFPEAPVPVAASGSETNCIQVGNPALVVQVDSGDTVNWYADPTGTNLLARGVSTNGFTPAATLPGSYTYYVQTVESNDLVSTNLTPVTLVLQNCTNTPEAFIPASPANSTVIVAWYGNLWLESTTNLVPPINWISARRRAFRRYQLPDQLHQ